MSKKNALRGTVSFVAMDGGATGDRPERRRQAKEAIREAKARRHPARFVNRRTMRR